MPQADTTKTVSVTKLKNMIDKDHYLVAAYDSMERINQKVLAVDPSFDEPHWILRAGARSIRRSNVHGMIVPRLSDFTMKHAQELTHVGTDYITVRPWGTESRRAGVWQGQAPIQMPWNR